ncbi:hypothetical protein K488DRAFT_83402 [Vararia minispora EC-137]|uniref:Uncharacterized protein n=1 Tax=Vararia minispora EC-137 TaxID=1314806 RepID=A0ACB8QTC8_9AGAM|nr:hypothetical protein K488DRAFT_83402 [Vararia minispora EC-137]
MSLAPSRSSADAPAAQHTSFLTAFVAAYPLPAFILSTSPRTVNGGPSIVPVFANPALHALLVGRDAAVANLDICFLPALGPIDQARRFTDWAFSASHSPDAPVCQTFTLELLLAWLPADHAGPRLELVQTRFGDVLVCTATPRGALPEPLPLPASGKPQGPSGKTSLRLSDLSHSFVATTPSSAFRLGLPDSQQSPEPVFVPRGDLSLLAHPNTLQPSHSSTATLSCIERCAILDWALTPLGPRSEWSETLCAAVSYTLANPFPTCCWWGSECVLVYNDAYAGVAGKRHPDIFGKSGSKAWAELWETLGPLASRVQDGQTVHRTEDQLFLNRLTDANLPEETYQSWNYVPVRNKQGKVEGILNTNIDVTQKVVTGRRMDLLRELSTHAALARTQTEFATTIIDVLRTSGVEAPFAAIYFSTVVEAREHNQEPRTSYVHELVDGPPIMIQLSLRSSVGIPEHHPFMPSTLAVCLNPVTLHPSPNQIGAGLLSLHSPLPTKGTTIISDLSEDRSTTPSTWQDKRRSPSHSAASFWPFAESFSSRTAVHIQDLPGYVVDGFERRCWDEHPREAVIIPLTSDDSDIPDCLLVLGLNSRLAYDKPYEAWIDLLRMSLNALLTAVQGREADVARATQLAQLDEAKTTFFSNASHELRTPLTLIQGPLQDCLRTTRSSKVKENLEIASRNVSRLKRLVDGLLDFSKLAANRLEDTLQGSITVTMEIFEGRMNLTVADTGVGIPSPEIDKIFDRFHRVHSASRSYEGTGIGLSLTKELVLLHGGTLTVTSTAEEDSPNNHGSKFVVSIPLGKEHLPAPHIDNAPVNDMARCTYGQGIIEEAGSWNAPKLQAGQRTPSDASEWDTLSGSSGNSSAGFETSTLFFLKSDRILLVDDNADMRRYIKSLFTPFCHVIEASNGEEALKIIGTVRPNLVISDVMMPGLDGFELITQLRERPDTRFLPIVFLTAKESEEARVEGLLSGADEQPFTAKELIARVHLQMQLGKRRVELEEIVTYVNQRWRELTGLDDIDTVDQWLECVHEDDSQSIETTWIAALDSQRSLSLECKFENGCYVQGQFDLLMSDCGTYNGIIGTITDISDQKKLEQARLSHARESEYEARRQAEEAEQRRLESDERRRGQELLIDVTSHELRQPVSAILNCSNVVRSNMANLYEGLKKSHEAMAPFVPSSSALKEIEDDLDGLDAIYQCGLAQERIANDVLSLSRIQLGVLSIHPVDFDLVAETRNVVARFSNEVRMKGIHVKVEIGKSLEELGVREVRSDKARLGQILTNLLSNGIKFTDMSTEKRDITITLNVSRYAPRKGGPCLPPGVEDPCSPPIHNDNAEAGSVYIFVSVRDSGPGLQPDDLALLFRRFQQGSNSHNVFGGSGLGLFVSRKLCDLMGGRIDVDSVYGQGATFRFFVKALAVPKTSSVPRPTSSFLSSAVVGTWSGDVHVLVVEDNLINQTILNRQLKREGFLTVTANNGKQAIEQVRLRAELQPRKHFDVVLMDCEMPVMDGIAATREIRRMEVSGEIPIRNTIFALTGNAREGQVENAREAGMDDVIIKPYKIDQLTKKILEVASIRS